MVRDARRCRAPLQEGSEGGQFLWDDALSAGCLQGGAELGGFVGGFERPNSGMIKCSDSTDVGAGDMIADRAPRTPGNLSCRALYDASASASLRCEETWTT